MTPDLLALALTFGAIFIVELPDKTFLATLVLSTRYRPVLVWLGVGLAFAVQAAIAVLVGQAASLLPQTAVRGAALTLFLIGAAILVREGLAQRGAGVDAGLDETQAVSGWRVVLTSFIVLFTAEWGDLSQLLTISLAARYEAPGSVYVGALGALLAVSALAVIAGRTLLRFIALHVLHFVGAGVCLLLAVLTLIELIG